MQLNRKTRVLVCISQKSIIAELQSALATTGLELDIHQPDKPSLPDLSRFNLILISAGQNDNSLKLCRRFQEQLQDTYIPILVLTPDGPFEARMDWLEAGADGILTRPWTPEDLIAQCKALWRTKERLDKQAQETSEFHRINQRLQQAYEQIDQELDLTRKIHSLDVSSKWPTIPGMSWALHRTQPGRVGGDFFDLVRIDEETFGCYLGDAMGHSVHASLLGLYAQKSLKTQWKTENQETILAPESVLTQLNQDLLQQNLPEGSFLSLLYATIHFGNGQLCFARAGQPHPILIPASGQVKILQQEGFFLGIAETRYQSQEISLIRGDKILFYSDGIESLPHADSPTATDRLLHIVEQRRMMPVKKMIEQIGQDLLAVQAVPGEEITLLGLEYTGTA